MEASTISLIPIALTFRKYCSCGTEGCVDCRTWVVESNVPLDPAKSILPVIADTTGVDSIKLIHHKYSIFVVFGSSYDAEVVKQSIRENLEEMGPFDPKTGDASRQRNMEEPPQEDVRQLSQAVATLAHLAASKGPSVTVVAADVIVFDRRRFIQVYPRPETRSWIVHKIVCWLLRW